MCKIRLYILSISWAIATWCLVGASIDRFLCSSPSAIYRQWSTNRIARRYVIGVFIFYALLFIQVFYCFEASVPNVPVACYGRNLPCRLFNDWVALRVDIVLPSLFLAIFGVLTIRNVQTRMIHPTVHAVNSNNTNNNRLLMRNKERNLTRMLLIQVLIVLPLDLPFGIYRPYASLTSDVPKTEATAKYIPGGEKMSPEDVSGVIALLAGPESQWITGQTLQMSGGVHMT
ncbi:unnamed protein product [Rotaria sordida]|nr:unnamed protein product [Rotaria sordida]CAF1263243.1 unnamed protein product [Rotaria sordida]